MTRAAHGSERGRPSTAGRRLRELLQSDDVIVAPGVFDGLSARLVERAGFPVVYASGGAVARSTGLPDMGLVSAGEVAARLESIVDAVEIPVIADADSGYGNTLNVRRTVARFLKVGIAALHIEDQTVPKRCGHYEEKSLVTCEEMVQKLRAAHDVLGDSDVVLIARTDALAMEGFEAAVERGRRYMEAGADMLFVEAPRSESEIARLAEALPCPKLLNMFHGGKTPVLPLSRLGDLGYRLVIVPGDLQRAAIRAMEEALQLIRRDGSTEAMADRMASFAHREEIVRTDRYMELARAYAS